MQSMVPALEDSALTLHARRLETKQAVTVHDAALDSLLYVAAGSGSFALDEAAVELGPGSAALVLAGETATVAASSMLELLHVTVDHVQDRHASLGPRETVVRADVSQAEQALGTRSFQVLFGPHNGSTRATLFVGFLPPGRSPWHYHLYDEIVWIPDGPGRLHRPGSEEPLAAGSSFRIRPREVHIVENASPDREMTLVGIFTPAGSPSAAYLASPDTP